MPSRPRAQLRTAAMASVTSGPPPIYQGDQAPSAHVRRLPVGAEIGPEGVHFRVWAPASPTCAVEVIQPGSDGAQVFPLMPGQGGYFAGLVQGAGAGLRYRFRLAEGAYPDPASRFQPDGPHGPSEVVDPAFAWTDGNWRGRPPTEWVMYELHLGTFTAEGTWAAAQDRLPHLAELGVTVVEVMPVADFPGRFGWGYDGVDLFAPCRLYGDPRAARAFVNRAHELGLMVILDVVYNHVGPDGNFLRQYSPDYFSARYANEWGEALNFDGRNASPVREFFASNARYWIEEYHLDGLRLDATQQMFDSSPTHILAEINAAARAAAGGRSLCLVAENESQHADLVRAPAVGGYGLDALWNDDFHHAARVAATGRAEAYYSSYRGHAPEFVSCATHGFLYQGQWCRWQNGRRGRPALDLRSEQLVVFLQNHDQVANALRGERLHQQAGPAQVRALTALLLLGPNVPLLFQGQEFAASAPFLFFADHAAELARKVQEGRAGFLRQFASLDHPGVASLLPDPADAGTLRRCRLDWTECERHADWLQLHADLLRLRREDRGRQSARSIAGAVLTEHAFVLRYLAATGDGDRLLVVNLGTDARLAPAPEPLLAPLPDTGWRVAWSSEDPAYGGRGIGPVETQDGWMLPAHSAVWMEPDENRDLGHARFGEKD